MQIPRREWTSFPRIGEEHSEEERRLCSRFGGKGANLIRLQRAGLTVPPGFIVPVEAFRAALVGGFETDLERLAESLESAAPCPPGELRARHPELIPLVEQLRQPLASALAASGLSDCWLAVRSSGTLEDGLVASYAGVLESFLGVKGEHLPDAVVLCWASAFTRRCREYSEAIGNDPDDMALAVLVQPVLPAVASGIIHTRDPLTEEPRIVVEAVRGLNNVACDGHTSPETLRFHRFRCDRTPGDQSWQEVLAVGGIRRVAVPESERRRPVLTSAERRALAALARRVETLLEGPQDIEWTLAQGQIWLLQARPVTPTGNSRVWTRANLRELYPEVVSPLTGSLIRRFQQTWYVDYFARLGFDVRHLGAGMRVICGRPYLNLSLLRCLAESAGVDGSRVEAKIGSAAGPAANRRAPDLGRAFRTGLPLLRILGRYIRAATSSQETIANTRRRVAAMELPDTETLADREIMEGVFQCFRALQPLYDATADVAGAIETLDIFTQAVPGLGSPDPNADTPPTRGDSREVHEFAELIRVAREDPEIRVRFLSSGGSGVPPTAAFRGSAFGDALERYLADYGFRALYESDSSVPRYCEDPRPLLSAIQSSLRGGSTPVPGSVLADASPAASRPREGRLARRIREHRERLLVLRQEIRKSTSRLIAEQRRWELTLARRWAVRGWIDREEDFWWLPVDDIEAALANPELGAQWLRERAERRHARAALWEAEAMPIYWPPRLAAEASIQPIPAVESDILRGIPVCPGIVEGRVKLVLRPEDAYDLEPGHILVAPFAGPAWAPFFATAQGLVVELGGALSHSAILAREYGLPAVANVPEVTRLIQDGDTIRIDGGKGLVWRLEPAALEAGLAAAPEAAPEAAEVVDDWALHRSLRRHQGERRGGTEVEWAHQEAA